MHEALTQKPLSVSTSLRLCLCLQTLRPCSDCMRIHCKSNYSDAQMKSLSHWNITKIPPRPIRREVNVLGLPETRGTIYPAWSQKKPRKWQSRLFSLFPHSLEMCSTQWCDIFMLLSCDSTRLPEGSYAVRNAPGSFQSMTVIIML